MEDMVPYVQADSREPPTPVRLRGRKNSEPTSARVVLAALFSERFPAIGESHGLSAVAGAVVSKLGSRLADLETIDKVCSGDEDCSDIVAAIRRSKANVVGIGVQYGTFSVLQREYPRIRDAFGSGPYLVVFGGPLASYLGDDLLSEIEPGAVVVEGEGDEALPLIILDWLDGVEPAPTANTRRLGSSGETLVGKRILGNLAVLPPPYREHVRRIADTGGQVYVEASRGCSWAACTFCLRGVTDVKGRPSEYRRFPIRRLELDLEALRRAGVASFTFADEDFLGGRLDSIDELVASLTLHRTRCNGAVQFDISVTIDSVIGTRDGVQESRQREGLLRSLQSAGLRKAFLGIESGSTSQLRRYMKGHTPDECAAATTRLRELGVSVEIGFIMFDPLCTIEEISENLAFLDSNGLIPYVSSLTNEMRLQRGARYVPLLEAAEVEAGRTLYERSIDRDTLSHSYSFASDEVAQLVDAIRRVQGSAQAFMYPLKALTRYGEHGALGPASRHVRSILEGIRNAQFAALNESVSALVSRRSCADTYSERMVPALELAATSLIDSLAVAEKHVLDHAVVQRVIRSATLIGNGSLRPRTPPAKLNSPSSP